MLFNDNAEFKVSVLDATKETGNFGGGNVGTGGGVRPPGCCVEATGDEIFSNIL